MASKKMRTMSWNAVQKFHQTYSLIGCYILYPKHEAVLIEKGYLWEDIVKLYEQGCEFGIKF